MSVAGSGIGGHLVQQVIGPLEQPSVLALQVDACLHEANACVDRLDLLDE